jgi:hypothetical protein
MWKKMVLFAGLAIAAISWTAAPASAQYYGYGPGNGPGNGPSCGPPGGINRCAYRQYGWSGYRYHRSPWSSYAYDRVHRYRHYY